VSTRSLLILSLVSWDRDHRGPDSFPTRRSSDLRATADLSARGVDVTSARPHMRRWLSFPRRRWTDGQTTGLPPGLETTERPCRRSEEHTSNSSHVKISYAVFCLKKKTSQSRS